MNLQEINELSKNSELRKRVKSAILVAATQISGEDPTTVTPALTAIQAQKRHSRATLVINSSQKQAEVFANAISAQPGLYSTIQIGENDELVYEGTGTLDGDIQFTVNSVWDDVAGVSYEDKQP